MSTRIHGGQHPHLDGQLHDAQAAHTHAQQTHAHQGQVSHVVMQRKLRANKIQHNKAQMAAFYRNKRFAAAHGKDASAAGQKLLRQLGTRPRPSAAGKPRDKAGVRERPEDGLHDAEQRHDNDPHRDREQKHGREREHEQDQQKQQPRDDRRGQQQRNGQQGEQQRHGQQQHASDDGQQPGQQQGQQQGQAQQQSQQQQPQQQQQQSQQQHHERRARGDKPLRFAVKKTGGAARTISAPMRLQALAERHGASPALSETLADGYARDLIALGRELQQSGRHAQRQSLHLMLPLALLSACSRAVLKRQPAQLQAQINSALAQPGNGTVGARVLGHTLDLTLARQRFRIEYGDDQQSLSAVRARLMQASQATGASAAADAAPTAAVLVPRSPGAS